MPPPCAQAMSNFSSAVSKLSKKVRAKPYLLVPLGRGGTFKVNGQTPANVGFTDCDSTTAVYFMIDEQRYFAANIGIQITRKPSTNSMLTGYSISERRGLLYAYVATGINRRLEEEASSQSWVPNRALARATLAIIGQDATEDAGTDTDYCRWATGDVVQQWLGIVQTQRVQPTQQREVILSSGGKVERVDEIAEARRWRAIEAVSSNLGWHLNIKLDVSA